MSLDIPSLALMQGLMFATQVLVLGLQYALNRSYKAPGQWVAGAALMALGVILMPLVMVKSLQLLALFSNPLYVLGLFFIHVGIVSFLGGRPSIAFLAALYSAFLLAYLGLIFVDFDLGPRTVVLNAVMAVVSLMIARDLFVRGRGDIYGSARFVAIVFLVNAGLSLFRGFDALGLPAHSGYEAQAGMLRFAFVYPAVLSTLWTFGFVIMLNQRLNEKVAELARQLERERNAALQDSVTDSLTGLPNRRRFDETLATEFRRLRRNHAWLSVIMADIDLFKDFNDAHGHPAGDECLRRIGGLFASLVGRAPDLAARYGGEEFAFILPETDLEGALILAERIRAAVEGLAIPYAGSALPLRVTVSLGLASQAITETETQERIVRLADEALYKAKRAGRNRVEVAGSS